MLVDFARFRFIGPNRLLRIVERLRCLAALRWLKTE
jgi:hypothetical protein